MSPDTSTITSKRDELIDIYCCDFSYLGRGGGEGVEFPKETFSA